MSGKPSSDGVQDFRFAVSRVARAEERVAILRQEIASRQQELENQENEWRTARELMFKSMEEMDVKSNGNAGYEGRATAFFVMLYKQLAGQP